MLNKLKCFFRFHDIDYKPVINVPYPTMSGICKRCGKYDSYLDRFNPFKPYPNSDEVIMYRAKIDSKYKRDQATKAFNEKHGLCGAKKEKENE